MELYRKEVGDYPKFFKMDPLARLGFVASEMLLKECPKADYGVLLFNRSSSMADDLAFQATIMRHTEWFPSPALFVYTLPNIVTGEIAIRNHYRGETSFYVLDGYDTGSMAFHLQCAFQDDVTESLLAGWVDSTDNDDFRCFYFFCWCYASDYRKY